MPGQDVLLGNSLSFEQLQNRVSIDFDSNSISFLGGLFLDNTVSSSIIDVVSTRSTASGSSNSVRSHTPRRKLVGLGISQRENRVSAAVGSEFLSVSLSIKRNDELFQNSTKYLARNGDKSSEEAKFAGASGDGNAVVEKGNNRRVGLPRRGAMNTTKHLWSGAVAAMVSRTFVAPLERLKLEYILCGEKKHLLELIKSIAASQGLKGFWKGNLVNILRTAPFKAVNFYSFDTYRKQFLKFTGNEEITNFERFIAGAAAGITATLLCLPLDTIRTKMVAPGGEALGGVIGAFRHVIQTEGFFSLYKGLLPSIMSVAPSGAVFYGMYDILKSAYLHSAEGRKRIENMKQHSKELNVLDQLELGPMRTLLHGAIAGACAEAATYPFEVVRRQLQLQGKATRLSAFATCVKIVEQRGIPALYAGLLPSLLQVLPSAAISYFVYEFMKIFLKVK